MIFNEKLTGIEIAIVSGISIFGIVIGVLLSYAVYYHPTLSSLVNDLSVENDALKQHIVDQRNTITAYQRALIGEERDLLSMYDSAQEAGQVDIVVHSDTESGLPIKFILDCKEVTK